MPPFQIIFNPTSAAELAKMPKELQLQILGEFRGLLPGIELQPLGRFEFYDAARSPELALVIATGERRVYANILLTIGVVPPA